MAAKTTMRENEEEEAIELFVLCMYVCACTVNLFIKRVDKVLFWSPGFIVEIPRGLTLKRIFDTQNGHVSSSNPFHLPSLPMQFQSNSLSNQKTFPVAITFIYFFLSHWFLLYLFLYTFCSLSPLILIPYHIKRNVAPTYPPLLLFCLYFIYLFILITSRVGIWIACGMRDLNFLPFDPW